MRERSCCRTCSVRALAWLCPCCRALSCFLRAVLEACICWHRCSSLCASSLMPADMRTSSSRATHFLLISFFFSSNCSRRCTECQSVQVTAILCRATRQGCNVVCRRKSLRLSRVYPHVFAWCNELITASWLMQALTLISFKLVNESLA